MTPLDAAASLHNPHRSLRLLAAEIAKPPPPLDLSAWAEENVTYDAGSPFPGPYRPELFPFFREVLKALAPDDASREVALMKSAQVGGTDLAMIFVGAAMDRDPGPILYTHPTDGNAARWSKTKWRPFIKKALPGVFKSTSSRDGGNSVLYQEREDGRGWLQAGGANSAASLSMISVSRQVQDDLSKWEMNLAGDPEQQANSRSQAFAWAKIFKISTPLVAPGCRITAAFERGTQERYHVPCPHCGHMHALEWEHFVIPPGRPQDAHFACPACGGVIEQHHRSAMVRRGRWVADNPGSSNRSFYIWAAYSALEAWQAIAERWLAAEDDPMAEQVFMNDTLGRPYRVKGEAPPYEDLKKRADTNGHTYAQIPVGGVLLTAGIDVQGSWCDVNVWAFGRDLKRWLIERRQIEGYITEDETWAALDALLDERWAHAAGGAQALDMIAIDGNAFTQDVYSWAKRHPMKRVMMVRGNNKDTAAPVAPVVYDRKKDGKAKKYGRRFWNVGVSGLKRALYQALAKAEPEHRSYVGFPRGMELDYFQELTAHSWVPGKDQRGFTVYRWKKDSAQRDEALDGTLYAESAALRLGWRTATDERWERMEAKRRKERLGEAPTHAPRRQKKAAAPEADAGPADDLTSDEERREKAAETRAAKKRQRIRIGRANLSGGKSYY